jgi:hypothetical protein
MPARKRSAASPRGAAGVGAALARKNPLRVAGDPVPVVGSAAAVAAPVRLRTAYTPREMRQMMISEFGDWLRTQTNKQRRPFQEETVQTYTAAALTLRGWTDGNRGGLGRLHGVRYGRLEPVLPLVLRGAQPGRDEYEATEPAALVLVAGYRVRAPAPVYGRSCAVCTETVDVSSAYAFEVNGPCTWVKVG